jgi:predicted acetyltransferase
MSLEIRPITDDEVEQAEFLVSYAFNTPNRGDLKAAAERARRIYPLDWSLGAFDQGEMVAFMRVLPFAVRINGRGLPMGGVSFVATLPQHRRRGYVGRTLRHALGEMRDRGQSLSGLYTPHPALYRRFGWEIASGWRSISFPPKDVSLRAKPREPGSMRLAGADDWQQLDRVYRAYCRERTGALHRPELWWREGVFGGLGPFGRQQLDAVVWSDAAGEPQGYLIYGQMSASGFGGQSRFYVRELVALTGDAYLNLAQVPLRHDLAAEVYWTAAPDDPFAELVENAEKLKIEEHYGLLLRVVDVAQALGVRPPGTEHVEPFTLALADPSAPWNEGTWRIEAAEGQSGVERVEGDADLSLGAPALAALFSGYLSPSNAALIGLIDVGRPEALAAADRFFATRYPPHCADVF